MVDTQSTVDTLLELEDGAAAITATETNSGGILDLGSGVVAGDMVVDVSAIDVASNDEDYMILLQGSTKDDFADTIYNLAHLHLGALEVMLGGADQDSIVGRYRVPFVNFTVDQTILRYVRSRIVVAGTTPSITYRSGLFIGKHY